MWGTTSVPVESGSAAGYLAVLGTDLPALAARVDGVATSLRDLVNGVHQQGFQADGTPGGLFFDGTDAASMTVVPTLPAELRRHARRRHHRRRERHEDRRPLRRPGRRARCALGLTSASAQWSDVTTLLGVRVQSLKKPRRCRTRWSPPPTPPFSPTPG